MPIRLYTFFASFINTLLSLIGFFIGFRIIFKLFAANPATPLVSWIYNISDFLITPIRGIFPNFNLQSGVLDLVAIIALVGYMIVGYILLELFRNLALSTTDKDLHITSTAHYHDIEDNHH